METNRIDKWLWAVRLFKTRSQATAACKGGKVKVDKINVKPSREVKLDDIIQIQISGFTKTVKVTGLLKRRVSARLAVDYVQDITPVEEIEKRKMMKEVNYEWRDRGVGRPTKKQRRLIERLKNFRHFN
ncbi:MAG: S4 domain-containing protein [Bacteroidota bacterium]|nr:S4 domain-containing protein [Bacteroidota bacterium]